MNSSSKTQKPSAKKEAVGADGLTKKERRALKVQSKQPHQKIENNKDNSINVKTEENKTIKKDPESVNKQLNEKNDVQTTNQLNEKELRKLEWEKKLATQKQTDLKNNEGLSKAELKAKRREQQEAQRLAKTAVTTIKTPKPSQVDTKKEEKSSPIKEKLIAKSPPKIIDSAVTTCKNRVELVAHLYLKRAERCDVQKSIVNYKNVHPAFIRLGVQYASKTIFGSNARLLGLLSALKTLVDDLQTPPEQEFCRYLESVLQSCTNYLQACRPLAVCMANVLRQFNLQLTEIDTTLSDNKKRSSLIDFIDTYVEDDIIKAGEAIRMKVNEKITNGDVILTYGSSSLIRKILIDARKDGKNFEVVVVDGKPYLEGREQLRRLVEANIPCKYVQINAICYIMGSVSKVLLGAHALLTNGYVMSRLGTAQVALVAKACNKPVLVCCEKYKFSERVQTDSFVYNEIGDNENSNIKVSNDNNKLTYLNLMFDVTPPDLVTAVVTELAILPCTSAPVVLRINAKEIS